MALPNDKISTTLVANTLGTSSRDVGALCTHQAINKWSKWKPIRVNLNGNGLTENVLIDYNCGFNIPFFVNRSDLIAFYNANKGNEWEYARPTKTTGFRIGDFRGYAHDAIKFYTVAIPPLSVGGGGVTVQMGVNASNGGMTWSDVSLAGNSLYFGATGSNGQTIVEDEPITQDNVGYVVLPTTSSIDIFSFLAQKSPINPSVITRYYPLVDGSGYAEFATTDISVSMVNNLLQAMNRVMSQLTLTKVFTGSVNLLNVSISVRYGDRQPSDIMGLGEASHNFGNILLNHGTPQAFNHSFNNVLMDYNTRGGYVYFQCTSHPQLNQIFGLNILQ